MSPAPFLVPALAVLRSEFNALNPKRDTGADGWIGDKAHQQDNPASKHNPDSLGRVLALDIDSTGPWPLPFDHYVLECVEDPRLELIIWNRRIASRSPHGTYSAWAWRPYTGTTDQHTGHAHFEARHDHTGQDDTRPWGIEDTVTPDDAATIASKVWAAGFGPAGSRETAGERLGHVDLAVDDLARDLDAVATEQTKQGDRLTLIEKAMSELLDRVPPPA